MSPQRKQAAQRVPSAVLRRRVTRLLLGVCCLLLVGVPLAMAQSGGGYDLSWWTADSGGGGSEGGGYTLTGAAGQPDAGVMAGGDYLLAGGFLPGGLPPERHRIYLPVVARNH